MTNLERAKQFAPFNALRGFDGIIKNEEKIPAERPELCEEECEEISNTLNRIKKGDIVKVKYFLEGYILSVEGAVTYFDSVFRKLRVVKTDIFFNDLVTIERLEQNGN